MLVKRIFILGALLLGGYFVWQNYFAAPQNEHPIVRLSLFIDEHVDGILGPLPVDQEGVIAMPGYTHDLRVLRESIRDLQTTSPAAESLRYSSAIKLCDELMSASEERDSHIARLNDTRAKSNISPLAADPERHRAERLTFFQNGIALSWHEASGKLRRLIDRRYGQLRELERVQ